MNCRVFICSTGWPAACGITTVPFIWKRLEWCGWMSVGPRIPFVCSLYQSVHLCACAVDWAEGQMKGNHSNQSTRWDALTQQIWNEDTGLDLIVSFLYSLLYLRDAETGPSWMTDMYTNNKRQEVYWMQMFSLNPLLNLVVIWRRVSLYFGSSNAAACNHWQWVTGKPSQKYWEERWQDGPVVKETIIQPENAGLSSIHEL